MSMLKRNLVASWLLSALMVASMNVPSRAQEAPAADIWQSAPPSSLLVLVYDGRAENASIKALAVAESPETKEARAKQRESLRKGIEDLMTLFGVRLDFAKDIDSWADRQSAVVLLPEDGGKMQAVFMIASKDAAAANATLQKIAAPWQRVGELTSETDSDCPVTAFKIPNKGVEVYASACKSLLAFSTSRPSIAQVLKGGGFAAGSPGDKVLRRLSDSFLYAFADPGLARRLMPKSANIPVDGLGLGISALDTGVKIRVLGLPSQMGAAFITQAFPTQQPGALCANPGIPEGSLAAASLPNLKAVGAMASVFGLSKNPLLAVAQAVSDTQISAGMTAALPTPAGVASSMTDSEQAAAEKFARVSASLQKMKNVKLETIDAAGTQATAIHMGKKRTFYLAQVGKHLLLATDKLSLAESAASARGDQPDISQSVTYKETLGGLGDSNLLSLYVNLAPVQGLGYLAEGVGVGQMSPIFGALATGLQNMQALGVGLGFDGEMATGTIFLRAKPGIGGGATIAGTAIAAMVAFPAIARVRQNAGKSSCLSMIREFALAATVYAGDHGGKLPTAANWKEQLEPYLQESAIEDGCPGQDAIYAFNKNLSGVSLSKIKNPSSVVMFFEADSDLPNASGSRPDARFPHNGQGCFAYADGHVQFEYEAPAVSQWLPYPKPKPAIKKTTLQRTHR